MNHGFFGFSLPTLCFLCCTFGRLGFRTSAAILLFLSCGEEKELVPPGSGAQYTDTQLSTNESIESLLKKELGEEILPESGNCPIGYLLIDERCVKQQIYRLLAGYSRAMDHTLTGAGLAFTLPGAAEGSWNQVYKASSGKTEPGDALYFVGELRVAAPNQHESRITVEVIHVATGTVVAKAYDSLAKGTGYRSLFVSGIFLATTADAQSFALRAQVTGAVAPTSPILVEAGGHLTLFHYSQFTVDDVFNQESQKKGYYQLRGLSPILEEEIPKEGEDRGKLIVTGVAKKLAFGDAAAEKIALKKGDLVVLEASMRVSFQESLATCVGENLLTAKFAINDLAHEPYSMKLRFVGMPESTIKHSEGDVQMLHGMLVLPITADQEALFSIVLNQSIAACQLTFDDAYNNLTLTYEVYRSLEHIGSDRIAARFLAEVSHEMEAEEGQTFAPAFGAPKENPIRMGSASVQAAVYDFVFVHANASIEAGVGGIVSPRIAGDFVVRSDSFEERDDGKPVDVKIVLTNNSGASLFSGMSQASVAVQRAIEIYPGFTGVEQERPSEFVMYGQFFGGGIGYPPGQQQSMTRQLVQLRHTSNALRVFRRFIAIDQVEAVEE